MESAWTWFSTFLLMVSCAEHDVEVAAPNVLPVVTKSDVPSDATPPAQAARAI